MSVAYRGLDKSSDKESQEVSGAPFAPWSVPAALCLATGIALAGLDVALWFTLIGSGILAALAYVRGHLLLALLVLLAPLGSIRYSMWEAQPNPLVPLMGEEMTFSGVSDGRYLRLEQPPGVRGTRVVLSSSETVSAGRVTVRGTLQEAADKRNPGGFDYHAYLARRNIKGQLFVEEVLDATLVQTTKARLQRGVVANLDERTAALMQAMTLGIRDGLGELREVFALSGLAHILALSGLHVGILVGAIGWLLRPLGQHRYPAMMLFLAGFVLLVGASPSVLRASLMVGAVLASLWLGSGRIEPWPALSLAALVTLLWHPAWLFDLSFQLSYLAVIGILLLTEPLTKRLLGERLSWWHPKVLLSGSVTVSIAAQALSLPLVASTFGNVPLFSPLVNVIAIPLATLLVPLGFLAGLLGLVSLPLAGTLNLITDLLANALLQLADAAAQLPVLTWGEVSALGYAFYTVGAFAFVLLVRGYLRPWRALLVITVAVLSSTVTADSGTPELIFLDVGQGDSVLVRLPGRVEILVDGGGTPFSDFDVGERTVLPALRAQGVDELELVIASHPDTDHIEGLVSVLEEMPVQTLVIGVPTPGKEVFDALIDTAARKGVDVWEVTRGETLHMGEARLEILNPPPNPFEKNNDNSVAFVLNTHGTKTLFLGDLSGEVERELFVPDVDLLMVSHHGSRHSTSKALLRAAQPERAVLSYGRNGYGHPSAEVLARLHTLGVETSETHLSGAIRIPLASKK